MMQSRMLLISIYPLQFERRGLGRVEKELKRRASMLSEKLELVEGKKLHFVFSGDGHDVGKVAIRDNDTLRPAVKAHRVPVFHDSRIR